MANLVLAIDQGTTGSTVLVIDTKSNIVGRGYREIRQIYPRPGWVEHDANDIWDSVVQSMGDALSQAGVTGESIAAIGITNQRETSVIWDRKTGEPCHNAIVWQCRRTSPETARLKEEGYEELFRKKTGLLLDPYFSGTKLAWMLDNVRGLRDDAEAARVAAGTIDCFLVNRLTAGAAHVTDVTNASRTLCMDINSQQWDRELLDILRVPRAILPEILPSVADFGKTKGVPGLPDGIPVAGIAGDQQAALFGQACFSPGEAKCTYGTGAFLLMNTGAAPVASTNRLLTTVAWKVGDSAAFALEGSAFIAGALVQWLRDGLGLIKSAPDIEALAQSVPDSGGLTLVPALAGLSAPHWRPDARGVLCGISRATTSAHLARAALEGIALQNVEILQAMEADSGRRITALKVDGGACANDLLMQIQADYLGCRIVRPKVVETTALGAAYLAGLGAGLFSGTGDIEAAWQMDREFLPQTTAQDRAEVLETWKKAVEKA